MEKKIETKKIYGAAPFEIDREGNVYRRSPQGELKTMKKANRISMVLKSK